MQTSPYYNLSAFVRGSMNADDTRMKLGVVKAHNPYTPGKRESVTVMFVDDGKQKTVPISEACIIPCEIPEPWCKILDENNEVEGIEHINVCYNTHTSPPSTTLFDVRTGAVLYSITTQKEGANVSLWDKAEIPRESKPDLLESYTAYYVGVIEIAMEADYYQ